MVTTRSVLKAFDLEVIEFARFRAGHPEMGHGVVSGGQLLGQSLIATGIGNGDKMPKTIHTIFAKAASADEPDLVLHADERPGLSPLGIEVLGADVLRADGALATSFVQDSMIRPMGAKSGSL